MAKIIIKRTVDFFEWKDNIITDRDGVKHNRPDVVSKVRVNPSALAQEVPDWVKSTSHYDSLKKHGELIEVGA
jgi:hypothetical protein